MSHIIQPWGFAYCTDNMTGTPPAALIGTNFTANANNADGTVVSVLSALAHDVHYIEIGLGGINSATLNSASLVDIVVDPAGGTSWANWIDDLVAGYSAIPTAGATGIELWYRFPITLKSGHSIGVRARNASGSNITTGRIVIYAHGHPTAPDMWWSGSKVDSLGINAASSSGTTITPGNTGTWGSWTTIGTTARRWGALQYAINGSDSSMLALGVHFEIGVGSARLPMPRQFVSSTSSEISARTAPGWIPCDIAETTVMQMRGTANTTAENYNAAIYGVF